MPKAKGQAVMNTQQEGPDSARPPLSLLDDGRRVAVHLKDIVESAGGRAKVNLPLFIGKKIGGQPCVVNLATMPHLLLAGNSESDVTVFLNTILLSLLMTKRPEELRMVLIDTAHGNLGVYNGIPHLTHAVITHPRQVPKALAWIMDEVERRYDLLSKAKVRRIGNFNRLTAQTIVKRVKAVSDDTRQQITTSLPYMIVVIHNLATLRVMDQVEELVVRMAPKSRVAGIHLILTVQPPTISTISGLLKCSLPARICFRVTTRTESRIALDQAGAEQLGGTNDLLFLRPNNDRPLRVQGTSVSGAEIRSVLGFWKKGRPK